MRPSLLVGLVALASWALAGCQEKYPTTLDGDRLPVSPITVQVTLPFEAFAEGATAWGGYGRPVELSSGVVARSYQGSLDARTLVGWSSYPTSVSVRDSTGTIRPDTSLTFVGGRMVTRIDTITSAWDGPVTLSIGAVQQDWDVRSASWMWSVDSVGNQTAWPEEGAGPVLPLAEAEWDPATGDSVVFQLDSAAVALWTDTVLGKRGIRVDAVTEGVRLNAYDFDLILSVKARSNPDTLVESSVLPRRRTFIYQPVLGQPQGSLWFGSVPAWRTVLELDVPETVDLPPDICAQVSCPVTLTPQALVSASLVLHSEAAPDGFQPTDTLRMDVREVLEPDRMPKSPLGFSLVGTLGVSVPPEYFGEEAGSEVLVPLTNYVEGLLQARNDSTVVISSSLALLSAFEPLSLYLASFGGPGSANPPQLRLLLTLSEGVQIR